MIPDQDILQSQFPEVLAEMEQAQARLAELQALFAAASEEGFEDQARHATSRNSGTPVTLIRSPTQRMGYALNALRP